MCWTEAATCLPVPENSRERQCRGMPYQAGCLVGSQGKAESLLPPGPGANLAEGRSRLDLRPNLDEGRLLSSPGPPAAPAWHFFGCRMKNPAFWGEPG